MVINKGCGKFVHSDYEILKEKFFCGMLNSRKEAILCKECRDKEKNGKK